LNDKARTLRFYLQWGKEDSLGTIIAKINHFSKVKVGVRKDKIVVE